ncbi:hypothetical protein KI387_028145, partial [Taxus chinensis]
VCFLLVFGKIKKLKREEKNNSEIMDMEGNIVRFNGEKEKGKCEQLVMIAGHKKNVNEHVCRMIVGAGFKDKKKIVVEG